MIDEALLTDPSRCPACAYPFDAAHPACPGCGLPLRGSDAQRVWTLGVRAAGLLRERSQLLATPRRVPAPAASPRPTRTETGRLGTAGRTPGGGSAPAAGGHPADGHGSVIGGAVLAADALAQLVPYVAVLARWASLGTVGVVLLVVGTTYESRARDLRVIRRHVSALG